MLLAKVEIGRRGNACGPGGSMRICRKTGFKVTEKRLAGKVLQVFLLFLALIFPPSRSRAAEMSAAGLQERVLDILKRYHQNESNWGIQVRSLDRGDDILRLNSTRQYMPASNLKLLVTAAALDGLGPDFKYQTTVLACGKIDPGDSLLEGDLVLRGSGDPTISDRFFPKAFSVWEDLAGQVAASGIRHVTGALVLDNTLFAGPYLAPGWGWEDLLWWYAAPVSALSYNDNCIDVEVFPAARVGEPPEIRILPPGSRITLLNRARTVAGRAEDHLVISRDSPGSRVSLTGGIFRGSLGFMEYVTVEDPARFAGDAFADALAAAGIRVDGPLRVLSAPLDSPAYLESSPLLLAQHLSVPLKDIVRVILKRSHNFYAEQLLFSLGAYQGKQGSFQEGLAVEQRFLRKAGLDTGNIHLEDGSGLSRLNLVTTETFITLLAYMDRHPAREEFVSSLPVGGQDNGVRQMRNTAADGKVFAKTGYISAVMALSGYTSLADGERVVFSILGNNWLIPRASARRLVRDVCVEITRTSRGVTNGEKLAKP